MDPNFSDLPYFLVRGANFTDADGDACIWLGLGTKTEYKPMTTEEGFHIPGAYKLQRLRDQQLYMCCYKGEWHQFSVHEETNYKAWTEGWGAVKQR